MSLERVKRELNAQGDSKEWAAQFTVVAMQIIPVKGIGKAVTDALTDVVIYLAEQLL